MFAFYSIKYCIKERNGSKWCHFSLCYYSFNYYFTGINDALDNDDNILYFGNNKHQTRGFNGCLDNLKIDDIPVSMDGKSTIAKRIAFEKIEFKCQARLDDAGVCSSQPCLNGGTCLEHPGSGSYQCTCNQPRYQGSQCELDRFVHTAKRIPEIDPKLCTSIIPKFDD